MDLEKKHLVFRYLAETTDMDDLPLTESDFDKIANTLSFSLWLSNLRWTELLKAIKREFFPDVFSVWRFWFFIMLVMWIIWGASVLFDTNQ